MTFTISPEVLAFALGWVCGVASLILLAIIAVRIGKRRKELK